MPAGNKRFAVMRGVFPQKVLSDFQTFTPAQAFVNPALQQAADRCSAIRFAPCATSVPALRAMTCFVPLRGLRTSSRLTKFQIVRASPHTIWNFVKRGNR